MRKTFLILAALPVVACGRSETGMPADSPAAAMAPPLTFAEFAGRWSVQLMGDMSDSVLASYDLTATADGAGWTLVPIGKDPIPVRAAVDGDSLMLDAGPYPSDAARPVDVTTHAVGRIEGGMLVGTFVSQYAVTSADSVVRGRLRSTRLP
jgi:hypothetical protein